MKNYIINTNIGAIGYTPIRESWENSFYVVEYGVSYYPKGKENVLTGTDETLRRKLLENKIEIY